MREGDWVVAVRVPEDRIDGFRPGLEGSLRFQARPEEVRRIRVTRIAPASSRRDGRNVYELEARGDDLRGDWLRAGMEGTARVDLGERQVWWIVLHPFLDFFRMRLWM